MRVNQWTVLGVGVTPKKWDIDRIITFIKENKELDIIKNIEKSGDVSIDDVKTFEELQDYSAMYEGVYGISDEYGDRGHCNIIAYIISEREGIPVAFRQGSDKNNATIMYETTYPWCMNESEKNLTEEQVYALFQKYDDILRPLGSEESCIEYKLISYSL